MTLSVGVHATEDNDWIDFDAASEDTQRVAQVEVAVNHSGFSGQGFADFRDDASASALRWQLDVDESATYMLRWRYALASGNRPLELRVNERSVEMVDFPATGDWSRWDVVYAQVELDAGENLIELAQREVRGANIDGMTVWLASAEEPEVAGPGPWNRDAGERIPDYELPQLLRTQEGEQVRTVEDWEQTGREEVLELFREHVYGRSPGSPEELTFEVIEEDEQAMGGEATLRRVAIRSRVGDREHEFKLSVFVPNAVEGPVPLFILINNRDPSNIDPTREERSPFWPAEQVVARGYAVAAFQNDELSPDNRADFTSGVIELFEGERSSRPGDAWAGLAAWGWGASRAMDYFETDDRVDHDRVAVVGHSRGGKASLWAGAEDERFAMVISNNSGCGGAALSRRRVGETVARIVDRFPYWFCGNFRRYADREDALPVDQHMLIGLIAPRVVYVASADEDMWADPRGEFEALAHGSEVYELYGHERIEPEEMPALDRPLHRGPMGYHIRSGGHNLTPYDWDRFMDLADEHWR